MKITAFAAASLLLCEPLVHCGTLFDYNIGAELARGSFGRIYNATRISDGEIVAIKKTTSQQSSLSISQLINEIHFLQLFQSSNHHVGMLQLLDFNEVECFMATEYAPFGNLVDVFQDQRTLDMASQKAIFTSFVTGIKMMHELNICHMDIKPDNILLFQDPFKPLDLFQPIAKIADLGTAMYKGETMLSAATMNYLSAELASIDLLESSAAPPNFDCTKADTWALGVVLYGMATKMRPFEDRNLYILLQKINQAQFSYPRATRRQPALRDLISKLLVKDPLQRLSVSQILQHPWLLPRNDIFSSFKHAVTKLKKKVSTV